jgi:hypothetical protein
MIRFEWANGPNVPNLQPFLEPDTINTANVEIVFANVEPGYAYRIEDLLPRRADGVTPWEDGFSHNDLSHLLFWPVSILHDEPYSRETLVSNVAFNIHHTRVTASQHAVRVRTFPSSSALKGVGGSGSDSITFGVFMESNIDTVVHVNTFINESNVVEFDTQIDYFELGSVYHFDNSNIRLIRFEEEEETLAVILAEPDELTGVMTVNITDPSLVGETVYIQQRNNNHLVMTSIVRDGSVRRLYKEYPSIPFEDLFGDGFQVHVLEFPHVDPTYDRYDVFITMRNINDRYITSHAFAHTVEPQKTYPSFPTTPIDIRLVNKSEPDNAVSFEYYPQEQGLQFHVREVGLRDMYQFILYPLFTVI